MYKFAKSYWNLFIFIVYLGIDDLFLKDKMND